MNNFPFAKFFVLLFGIGFGLYITIEVITSNTSLLGRLYLFVAIAAFLTGVLNPRVAMFSLIFCTAYIDLFKRLMVIAGQPTTFDVACTLATPPLLCAGAVINLIMSVIMGKFQVTKGLVWSFIFACAVVFMGFFSSAGEGLRGLGGMVNLAAYPFMLVIIPVYFRSIEDKEKLMRFIYICFIGVALYMIKQALYGLADFEYAYLLTNLSQEVRILVEGENMRCFSTMNGAAIVSIMCALMFFWSFVNVWKKTVPRKVIRWLIALIFAIACYFTLSRTGWVCGAVALIAYFLFLNWRVTVIAYLFGIISVILLVVFSPLLKDADIIAQAEVKLQSFVDQRDSRARQAATLGSFNGRINGWSNLMTKDYMWTPFGWEAAGQRFEQYNLESLGDDIIFWSVVKYGFVPVVGGLIIFLSFLYRLHRFVTTLPKQSNERKIATICLATSIAIIVGGLSNAAQLYVFPVNIYFYLCLSFVFSIYLNYIESLKTKKYENLQAYPVGAIKIGG